MPGFSDKLRKESDGCVIIDNVFAVFAMLRISAKTKKL